MDNLGFIKDYFRESITVKQKLVDDEIIANQICQLADMICEAYASGGKVMLAGNGGSAADSQHIAAEFVSRFQFDRPGLPALALTTDTSMLTAIGNDYGYENLFKRQLEAQGKAGDIFIGISTSGNSKNVVSAMERIELDIKTVAFCGTAGRLPELAELAICAPSTNTPHIQECHICIGHAVCALVEERMFG